MRRIQRYIISAFVLTLISCAAVGYAAAGGLSEGVVSETSVDTVSATQSNGSDFPLAGDANGTVPIRVEMDGIETATVTYGRLGAGQNVRFDATIRDTDGDGTATVTFDPTSFGGSTDGFSASEGTELVNTDSQYEDGLAEVGLANTTYDVSASPGETPYYESMAVDLSRSTIADDSLTNGTYERVELTASAGSDFPVAGDANGTVPIRVEMEGIETVTITYGQRTTGQNVRFDATVRDTDADGFVTVIFDPVTFGDDTDGFTAEEGTELVGTASQYADGLADVGLANGTYDVFVSAGETPHYESEMMASATSVLQDDQLENGEYERVEFAVAATAEFAIAEGSLSATNVDVSESVAMNLTVRNNGQISGEQTITFTSGGDAIGNKTVELAPGAEEVLTLEHTFESAGTYEIAADGTQIGEVTVETNSEENSEENSETDDESSDGSGPGFGVVAALVALCGVAFGSKYRG